MNQQDTSVVDGNQAAASVAYRLSEVIAVYPITPASPMGELSDEWAAERQANLWGLVPTVIEMQSEAVDDDLIQAHRRRALTPDRPVLRGTAQNPDVFFQTREAVNPYGAAVPDIVEAEMTKLAALCGRSYRLSDCQGGPDVPDVIVMGSGALTVKQTVQELRSQGRKVGCLRGRCRHGWQREHGSLSATGRVRPWKLRAHLARLGARNWIFSAPRSVSSAVSTRRKDDEQAIAVGQQPGKTKHV